VRGPAARFCCWAVLLLALVWLARRIGRALGAVLLAAFVANVVLVFA